MRSLALEVWFVEFVGLNFSTSNMMMRSSSRFLLVLEKIAVTTVLTVMPYTRTNSFSETTQPKLRGPCLICDLWGFCLSLSSQRIGIAINTLVSLKRSPVAN